LEDYFYRLKMTGCGGMSHL